MCSRYSTESSLTSPGDKNGKNLLWEFGTVFFVYAVCSLGNLLTMILLAECFLLPQLDSLSNISATGNPIETVTDVLSLPEVSILMLFSTAANIVVVILFCRFIQKRSWKSLGFSRQDAFRHYIRGVLFGGIAISAIVALCIVTGAGYFRSEAPASLSTILLFFLAFLIQGASEELLCRGYFMYSVARRYPMWLAVVLSSAFFALMHMPNSGVSIAAFLNLFLFGVFAALVTIRTGSIWYASGFHSAWNFFQGNFYGIKVSGMDLHGSLFHFVQNPAKAYLNGGDFGMEGGLLCTVLLIAGILFLLHQIHRNTLNTRS